MGQLAYDLQEPRTPTNTTQSPRHTNPYSHYYHRATTSPQVDAALRLFSCFTPRETKLFFDLMLARMSIPAKEALTQVVWTSLSPVEKEWFELPRRGRRDGTEGEGGVWSEEEILCGFAGAALPASLRGGPVTTSSGTMQSSERRSGTLRLEFGTLNSNRPTGTSVATSTQAVIPSSPHSIVPRFLSSSRWLNTNSTGSDEELQDEDEGAGNTLIAAGREMSARMAAREIEDSIFGAIIQAVRGSERPLSPNSGATPGTRPVWEVD
ncbi:uncharacterized protein SPPG_08767 [Spizellomyces punctatus DAOM BR117]|uniref:Uncharacterized protein n=1 Tax=Spizellomyces punctatus (strain DAOM BR117) TaxID=645134 RepID=A0A0L0H523_SPIPD|nr:uncharacterized protein SPPG_08767 [Spizellomyces punctatus DAOM BR117]KNC95828.1 hypothetical protein SPPG_08767 [Spizellomyces punctatus DAOM BR117]|eukprot:XP_016603868.1 hypothetical protein SPPG_08767 [Spizellomyces punctatus DAOM BR117]